MQKWQERSILLTESDQYWSRGRSGNEARLGSFINTGEGLYCKGSEWNMLIYFMSKVTLLLVDLRVVSFRDSQYGTGVLTGTETSLEVKGYRYCYSTKEFF